MQQTIHMLTVDEIKAAQIFCDHYRMAQARAAMALEQQAEYIAQLRAKYKLGDEWQLNDLFVGFVREGDSGEHNNQ